MLVLGLPNLAAMCVYTPYLQEAEEYLERQDSSRPDLAVDFSNVVNLFNSTISTTLFIFKLLTR